MKIFLSCLAIFISAEIFGQADTLRIKAQLKFGKYGYMESGWPKFEEPSPKSYHRKTEQEVKGLPAGWKNFYRSDIWHDYAQFVYQNYTAGKIDSNAYAGIQPKLDNGFETGCTSKEIQCYTTIIYRKNETGMAEYAIDTDGDLDFSDEVVYEPLKSLKYNMYGSLLEDAQWIKFETWEDTLQRDSVPVLISYDSTEYGEFLIYNMPFYAEVVLGEDTAIVNSRAMDFRDFFLRKPSDIRPDGRTSYSEKFERHERIKLSNTWYTIHDFEAFSKELVLVEVDTLNDTIYPSIGFFAPEFSMEDLLSGEKFSLADFNGKYVLLDFWGTWCAPCLDQIPDLVEINNRLKNESFQIVSIACFSRRDKVENIVDQHGMSWVHAMTSDEKGLLEDYKIAAYPSYFLLNPAGKIIGQDLNMEKIIEAVKK